MQIAVLGAGALGSLFAGTLSSTHEVTLVGHENAHLEAIRRDGLRIERLDGTVEECAVSATADHAAVAETDLLVLTVKSYDTESAMLDVESHLDGIPVLTLQNGLGNAEMIREHVSPEQVMVGTTTNGAYIESPGLATHTGWGETTIGRIWGENDPFVEEVADAFRVVGFDVSVAADIQRALWAKVLVNVGINPTTALSRVQNGALIESPSGERLLESAVREAERVARAEGVEFEHDPVTHTKEVARATATNHSSMLQDVEQGSKTEIDALNGAIVARAADHDIDVPVNRTLTDAIRLLEHGRRPGET